MRNALAFIVLFGACICLMPRAAYALCTNPVGAAGEILYNSDAHVLQYCDDTNWIGFVSVPNLWSWQAIDVSRTYSCGIKTDGTAWCWGDANFGQLGNGATSPSQRTPVAVSGGSTWKAISTSGRNNQGKHACGIKSDGTAWCWGRAANGQLGNGATTPDQTTPVAVSGGSTWKVISAGTDHTCGIKSDDTAWCWGAAANGRLGNGATTPDQTTPVAVSGGSTWKVISAGTAYTCGIKSDDTAWCWGYGLPDMLGDGAATSDQTTPVTVSGGGTWSNIAAGDTHTCGIKTDGTAWCWGQAGFGQLGNGGTSAQNAPVQVSAAGPWKAIRAVNLHTCGIKFDNTAWCWGRANDGRLGNDTIAPDLSTPDFVTYSAGSCVNPTGTAGAILFNSGYSVLQFCDGQSWLAMGPEPVIDMTPQTYTTPGAFSYTVPPGCTSLQLEVYGAGGGGGTSNDARGGAGGGGGSVVERSSGALLAAAGGGGGGGTGASGGGGGGGGYAVSAVAVSSGESLNFWVGGGGNSAATGAGAVGGAFAGGGGGSDGAGGTGGNGAASTYGGGGGGGHGADASGSGGTSSFGGGGGGGGAEGGIGGGGGGSNYGGGGGGGSGNDTGGSGGTSSFGSNGTSGVAGVRGGTGGGGGGYGDSTLLGASGSSGTGGAAANGGPGTGGNAGNAGGNGKVVITPTSCPGSNACSNPSGSRGAILYNTDFAVMQYCNGVNWIGIGK